MTHSELYEQFLKGHWEAWGQMETDQRNNVPPPPVQKPPPEDAPRLTLPPPVEPEAGGMPLVQAIAGRESRREYRLLPLSLNELSFLLWATQGVRRVMMGGTLTRRMVPSGGSRHPLETYLLVQQVGGLDTGLYRYLPLSHQVAFLGPVPQLGDRIASACAGFARNSAIVFAWTAIPYRTAYRYGELAPKLIALDAGHVCQNLYLACEAAGLATCAVGAYNQQAMDDLLGVDGKEEFTLYCAPVGRQ